MTTLQEAVKKFIEATKLDRIEFEDWPRDSQKAFETLRTALAQQGERKNCPQPEICGSKECEFCRDTAAPAPQAQEPVVTGWDNGLSQDYDKSLGRWFADRPGARQQLVETLAAPQPAQDVPEVGFVNMPYSPYLFGGLRFKMNFDKSGNATNFHGVESALQGAWVALVDATDNCHLQSAQPVVNQQMTAVKESLTPQSAQPVARPLTDAWIRERTKQPWVFDTVKQWVREIEAAHGIGRKPCS